MKIVRGITIEADIYERAKALAKSRNMKFSKFVETLVEKELQASEQTTAQQEVGKDEH
jgi:predicted CopG family antitoxin